MYNNSDYYYNHNNYYNHSGYNNYGYYPSHSSYQYPQYAHPLNHHNYYQQNTINNPVYKQSAFDFSRTPRWKDYENWMEESSDKVKSVPLNQLTIPGTHDSGTYELFTNEIYNVNDFSHIAPSIAGPIIRALAVTQKVDIYSQLMEGIRYLDLRFAKDSKGRIRIVHTVFGNSADAIFNQIKRFLDSHPKEVVIIDIQNTNNLNDSDHAKLKKTIMDSIGKHLASRNDFTPKSTIKNYYDKNKNAIIIYDKKNIVDKEPLYWYRNSSVLISPWYNTNNFNELIKKNSDALKKLPVDRSYFYVTQMIFSLNDSEIKNIILNLLKYLPIPIYGQVKFGMEFDKLVNTPGIYNLAAPHKQDITKWIASHSPIDNPQGKELYLINILISDFYAKEHITALRRYNYRFDVMT